jgi:hypothetical protein
MRSIIGLEGGEYALGGHVGLNGGLEFSAAPAPEVGAQNSEAELFTCVKVVDISRA